MSTRENRTNTSAITEIVVCVPLIKRQCETNSKLCRLPNVSDNSRDELIGYFIKSVTIVGGCWYIS